MGSLPRDGGEKKEGNGKRKQMEGVGLPRDGRLARSLRGARVLNNYSVPRVPISAALYIYIYHARMDACLKG